MFPFHTRGGVGVVALSCAFALLLLAGCGSGEPGAVDAASSDATAAAETKYEEVDSKHTLSVPDALNAISASSVGLVPTVQGGYLWTDAATKRLYGPGVWIMDGLWNVNIRRQAGRDTFAGIRFRALTEGYVRSVRLYWSDGSGYANGNGGTIQLRLLPDDGSGRHLPDWNAKPLATGTRTPSSLSMSQGIYQVASERFASDTLNATAALEVGKLYHLVAVNIASDPAFNWSSWDMQWTSASNGRPSRWVSALDYAALYGTRPVGSSNPPSWADWSVDGHGGAYVVPIMQMTMADGSSFGNANMESGNVVSNGEAWQNSSSNPIRERFIPAATKTITGLSINTALVRGSGDLGWKILKGSTVLASGSFAQPIPNVRIDSSVGTSTAVMNWYDAVLPNALTLNAGTVYDVQFIPQESSVWMFADQRNGSSYGFRSPAAFTESQAQVFFNGSWLNANHWNHSSAGGGSNWRVVLHTS